jgi:hypothetical protein
MKISKLLLGFVLGAFVLLTLAPLFGTDALAQAGRDCGPNSKRCTLHHESCTC